MRVFKDQSYKSVNNFDDVDISGRRNFSLLIFCDEGRTWSFLKDVVEKHKSEPGNMTHLGHKGY